MKGADTVFPRSIFLSSQMLLPRVHDEGLAVNVCGGDDGLIVYDVHRMGFRGLVGMLSYTRTLSRL